MTITRSQILKLAPQARKQYLDAFAAPDEVLAKYGLTTPLRIAHFLAQVLEETGGLLVLIESLEYKHAARLMDVWPKRFLTIEDALKYVDKPAALAERVYGGRMGNVHPGDALKYVGHGMLQITGLDAYQRGGAALGIDLVNHPELAIDPRYSLALAAWEFVSLRCLEAADADDVDEVTLRVNGGYTGLPERRAWLGNVKAAIAA